jgi:hopanoid biosynthesis associated protein HpnK
VEIARRNPGLGVGLHVSLSLDRSVLPHAEVPDLVDIRGRFGRDPFRVGLKYMLSRSIRSQLTREMEAQFDRFASTGLPWSHADAHQHMHMHPAVWETFLDLCKQHGVRRVRVPCESVLRHLRVRGDGPNANTAALLALRVIGRRNSRLLRLAGCVTCDHVYGLLQTGNLHSAHLRAILGRLEGATNEIYLHPGSPFTRRLEPDQRRAGVEDVEMDALLDPGVRATIREQGIRLGTHAEAEASTTGARVC